MFEKHPSSTWQGGRAQGAQFPFLPLFQNPPNSSSNDKSNNKRWPRVQGFVICKIVLDYLG